MFAKAFCFADSAYVIVGGSSPERGSLEIYHLTSSLLRISLTSKIKDRVVSGTLIEKSLGERGFRMFSF